MQQSPKKMTNNARVFNLTRRFYMKLGQVEKSIEKSCSFVWVIRGETFRDATPAEAVHMRNEQALKREFGQEVLTSREIPGLRFKGPHTSNEASREDYEGLDSPLALRKCVWPRAGYELVMRANNFCGLAQ